MFKKIIVAFLVLFTTSPSILAQLKPIPIGSWRSHYNYSKGKSLTKAGNKIFAAAINGFFAYDLTDNEALVLNIEDGFYDINISNLAYDEVSKILVIAYNSGAIDLAKLDNNSEIKEITPLLSIKYSTTLLGSKQVNEITFSNNIAYLSTDYGIVQVDLQKKQIKEIDQNLGQDGIKTTINSCTILEGKIYSITDEYLLEANLADNLQNYLSWKRYKLPNTQLNKKHRILQAKNELYIHLNTNGLFSFKNSNFQKLINIFEESNTSVTNGNSIFVALKSRILNFEIATEKTSYINDNLLNSPQKLIINSSKYWLSDGSNGLISNTTGSFVQYNPTKTAGLLTTRNDSTLKDKLGIVYTKLAPGNGLLISNKAGKSRTFSSVPLLQNNTRSSNTVNSIAVDKNNTIYLAVNGGIVAINSDERIIESQNLTDFISTPVIDGVRTLATEIVLSIAIDGGNRKWIGTEAALYLFNEDLSEIIQKFTNVNSPLPSNVINFLNLEPVSGELFVYTKNGIVSYRTNATDGNEIQENSVLVFPNPVQPQFNGVVGISGLVANAFVKITDVSGRLVYQTRANGGTASWDLTNQNGNRAESGIYFIFSGNEFGKESLVTKLAVIK